MKSILYLWPPHIMGEGFSMSEYIDWIKSLGATHVTMDLLDQKDWPYNASLAETVHAAGLKLILLANTATRTFNDAPGLLTKGDPGTDNPYHVGWAYDEATRRQAVCPAYRGPRLDASVALLREACRQIRPDILWIHWELFPPKYFLDARYPRMVETCPRCKTQEGYLRNRVNFLKAWYYSFGSTCPQFTFYHNHFWWPAGAGDTYYEMVSLHNIEPRAFDASCDVGPGWLRPVDGWPEAGVKNKIVCLTDVVETPTLASPINARIAGRKGARGLFMDGPAFSKQGVARDVLKDHVNLVWSEFLQGRNEAGI